MQGPSGDDFDKPLDVRLRARWRDNMRRWYEDPERFSGPGFEVPSPEDFLPTPRPSPTGFELFPQPGAAWLPNVLFVFMLVSSVLHWTWKQPGMSGFVASRSAVFDLHEVWRLITALGGHGDFMHLAHNAPIFWFFGWILNGYFGWVIAGVGALAIGIISNAITVWFYPPNVQLLGASGMVYGMVALWLTLYIRFDRKGVWAKRVMRSLGFSILVLFPQTYEANVSYLAHASGFAVGILVGLLCIPIAKSKAPVLNDRYYVAGMRL